MATVRFPETRLLETIIQISCRGISWTGLLVKTGLIVTQLPNEVSRYHQPFTVRVNGSDFDANFVKTREGCTVLQPDYRGETIRACIMQFSNCTQDSLGYLLSPHQSPKYFKNNADGTFIAYEFHPDCVGNLQPLMGEHGYCHGMVVEARWKALSPFPATQIVLLPAQNIMDLLDDILNGIPEELVAENVLSMSLDRIVVLIMCLQKIGVVLPVQWIRQLWNLTEVNFIGGSRCNRARAPASHECGV
jgi:hypothetical protein